VGQHQAALQLDDLAGFDGGAGQAAEAGIDAVDAAPLAKDIGDGLGRGLDGAVTGRIEPDRAGGTPKAAQLWEGQGPGSELKRLRLGHERVSSGASVRSSLFITDSARPKAAGQMTP